jgi:hypothetical protein
MNVPAHIHNIFGHEEIIHRVALVILSGLNDTVFHLAIALVNNQCHSRHISCVTVPFFGPRCHNDQLDAPLQAEHIQLLQQIYQQFEQL